MVEVSVYCCLQTGEPEMCNKVGLNSVNQKTTPWYNTYPIIMTVHPLNYDAEWRPKKIKSIPNIREAQKMMREKEMPAPNLWPPCIPVPLVWCSHEHDTLPNTGKYVKNRIKCLDPCGRALQEGMPWTSAPNKCQWYVCKQREIGWKIFAVFMYCSI